MTSPYPYAKTDGVNAAKNSPGRRRVGIAAAVLALVGAVVAVGYSSFRATYHARHLATQPAAAEVTRVFRIEGMHCDGCAASITQRVQKMPGVRSVRVSFEEGKGWFTTEPGRPSVSELVQAVKDAGYKPEPIEK